MYPVMLDLRRQPCLVVGGGQVALRKLESLLFEGAAVTVVASAVVDGIAQLAALGTITLCRRPFVPSDVEGCRLVMGATDEPEVNRQVATAARARGIWVNVADDPATCDFHLPARVQRGHLQLAIASGGGAPFAVSRLRQLFEHKLGPTWAGWMAAAKTFRQRVQAQALPSPAADPCYDRFVAETVDAETLAVRVPSSEELVAWSSPAQDHPPQGMPPVGHVSLVGAGPGNPGLLTVEGLRRLRLADAIVYDRLALPALPLDLPDQVELHDVGKETGHHPMPQQQINTLLIRLGHLGKRVVRLKGGDPFVFGRGAEEALALHAAGIPCDIIPGVTAGIAVPAAAGIPVTYRGEAVRLTFVTAHEGGDASGDSPHRHVRWDLLAQDSHATLVGYMGVGTLPKVSAALMAAGMNPATPAAVIEQGTLAGQRSVQAPLAELAAAANLKGIRPPAIFVIGQVVAHAGTLDALRARPLRGARVGMFAPASPLARSLQQAGAEVLLAPQPWTVATRLVLGSAPLTGWIVETPDQLDGLASEPAARSVLGSGIVWCVGARLACLARARGWASAAEFGIPALTDDKEGSPWQFSSSSPI